MKPFYINDLEVNEIYKMSGIFCLDRDYIKLDDVSVQVTEKNDYISFQIQEESIDIVNQVLDKTDNKDHLKWLLWEDLKGQISFLISDLEYRYSFYKDITITK
jgi:hypothetical protein|tara:strand:- start:43 stop:351 length:309 start_codon:yes stop_codon:yes gene_type:complete